jgi:hypothetical protein
MCFFLRTLRLWIAGLGVEDVRDQGVGDGGDYREEDEGREEAEAQREGGSRLCGSCLLVGRVVVGAAGFVGQVFEGFGERGAGSE